MKRCAFFLAIAAVLAVPAGASAFFRCWCAPRFAYGYGAGYGYGFGRFGGFPPYYYPAYPAYPYFAAPYYVNPVPSTPVAVPSAAPQAAKAEAPVAPPRAPIVTITPGESVKPAPKTEVEQVRGAVTPIAVPAPMNTVAIPDPMVPKSPAPIAVPIPAPSSDSLPPIKLPEFNKSANGKDDLPPIVLPPEVQKPSSGVIPPTTSRSSPLTGAVKVQVFTAMGATNGDLRQVGFFNHTTRDLNLVIAGKKVKLPKKSYLNARLPMKFTWKQAGGDNETAVVPTGAAGLDVLFKE